MHLLKCHKFKLHLFIRLNKWSFTTFDIQLFSLAAFPLHLSTFLHLLALPVCVSMSVTHPSLQSHSYSSCRPSISDPGSLSAGGAANTGG